MNTTINFLGVKFKNPIVVASGILGVTAASLKRCVDLGAGGVTMKSVSLEPRTGHPNPTMAGYPHYFMNAVGLSNPGVTESVDMVKEYKSVCSAPIIGSVFATSAEEFAKVSEILCTAPIDILEINLSCPNVMDEFGIPLAYSPEIASKVVAYVKKVAEKKHIPIAAKLSPNAWNNAAIAKACVEAGADAITAINTVSGMTIDVNLQCPVLSNKFGGISGPALKPIAVKNVWDVYNAVQAPIIATGGVTTGEDALEMMLAGGSLVGVGSAIWWRGEKVFGDIVKEMEVYMKKKKINKLSDLIGKAHK
ncbi:MAG: dihydroorotate dehydrogenase [Patescibacteria group bacterium]|jgi:dihydroorotate dehydrogenase (NAD+) catalytic subunit